MKTRLLGSLAIVAALAFTACPTTNPKKNEKKPGRTAKPPPTEENTEVDFQAFIGRLRQAVRARDVNTIASMMTPNFGYVLGATPAEDRTGAGVFQYWNGNNLWPEVEGVLSEKFVPFNDYMVAPPQFALDPEAYAGYRAGIQRVNGSWRFAYFVNATSSGGQPAQ
jgi:hypothetical protein